MAYRLRIYPPKPTDYSVPDPQVNIIPEVFDDVTNAVVSPPMNFVYSGAALKQMGGAAARNLIQTDLSAWASQIKAARSQVTDDNVAMFNALNQLASQTYPIT